MRLWRWIAAALVAANVVVIAALWWDGVGTVDGGAELLATLGRLTGLLGAFVALLSLLLIGLGRLARRHALLGRLCLGLLLAHAALITAGYTLGDGITLWAELGRLLSGYPGVITATAGLALLAVVAFMCGYLLQATRWRKIANTPQLGLRRFYEMVLGGLACNNVLP
ncbi:MAG TPA: hypothetical protein VE526_09170, partial [Solirubrobacteraceae bacterium]|nr:hypothetical protein [Solirubrobacteraceae bacterium]